MFDFLGSVTNFFLVDIPNWASAIIDFVKNFFTIVNMFFQVIPPPFGTILQVCVTIFLVIIIVKFVSIIT